MSEKSLQDFVEEVNGEGHLRVEHDFGDGFVRLRTSEAERRQAAQDIQCSENILIELLRNSKDAHAASIFVACSREGSMRTITVIDDGVGIPASMHDHVFEPRVTSKLDTSHMDAWGLHGRGMALYSISVNAKDAHVVQSETGLGCSLRVISDTKSLPEKKDQSTFPTFTLDENGVVNVRGPKNIVRTACEFAIESRGACSVYIGSPAEIAATLVDFGTTLLSDIERVFCSDENSLPIVKRLATASDSQDLALMCESIGIEISERTARRILDGEIKPISRLLDRITITGAEKQANSARQARPKAPRIRFQQEDMQIIQDALQGAFSEIAQRYYLQEDVNPSVRQEQGRLVCSIPIVPAP